MLTNRYDYSLYALSGESWQQRTKRMQWLREKELEKIQQKQIGMTRAQLSVSGFIREFEGTFEIDMIFPDEIVSICFMYLWDESTYELILQYCNMYSTLMI